VAAGRVRLKPQLVTREDGNNQACAVKMVPSKRTVRRHRSQAREDFVYLSELCPLSISLIAALHLYTASLNVNVTAASFTIS
jgi:hypothetical protein